jgi:hypothetical protein
MNDNNISFMPFNAINQFMVTEYRLEVIRNVFSHLDQLSAERNKNVSRLFGRLVNVPGFRNSSLAPLPIKIKQSITAFEKSAEFASQILMAWSELNSELRQQVYDILKERDWDILPVDADRTKLPGFMVTWPVSQPYEVLNQAFDEKFPQKTCSDDDVRLMIVWLSGRLPVNMEGEEESKPD